MLSKLVSRKKHIDLFLQIHRSFDLSLQHKYSLLLFFDTDIVFSYLKAIS